MASTRLQKIKELKMNEDIYVNSGITDNTSTHSDHSNDYEDIYANEDDVPETDVTRSHKGTVTSGITTDNKSTHSDESHDYEDFDDNEDDVPETGVTRSCKGTVTSGITADNKSTHSDESHDYEDVYDNKDDVPETSVSRSRKGTVTSVSRINKAKSRYYRLAAVLLFVLLLSVIMLLWVRHNNLPIQTNNYNMKNEMGQKEKQVLVDRGTQ
ncbi:uncharacterized protein LOC108414785 isoform X3 [Pygocentrus nattereri]|uniref:uncharacterized protein LOC108414785 isoform X3 n=1 Tax=Pygocentrus nattereri TaxID=42514 RepID=UPI0008143974|nr:uncharacterized protein LOC108414785 isoform X3 [Pygocentrus nattereri]